MVDKDSKRCSTCEWWSNKYGCMNANSEGFHKVITNKFKAHCSCWLRRGDKRWLI